MSDLISREYIKLFVCEYEKFNGKEVEIVKAVPVQAIDNAPTVEAKQGEWIMQRHDLDGCFYTCSNCGRMIRVPLFIDDPEDNETLADYPFCHCGAQMKGGVE